MNIVAVGLCHTDLAIQHESLPQPFSAVLGHEGAGIVEEIGSGVTKFAPGDKVVMTMAYCGECENCKRGDVMYCEQQAKMNYGGGHPDGSPTICSYGHAITGGFFGQSSFASYAIANERNSVKLPADSDLELAAPLGCGIQTGAGAVMNSLDAQPGRALAVFGGGAVGMSAAMGAVVRGCNPILVIEPVEARRKLALELGATHVIDPAAGATTEQIRAIVPRGLDYAIDTTAVVPVQKAALAAIALHGTIGFIGVPRNPAAELPLSLIGFLGAGVTMKAIIEGDSHPDEFIPEMYALYMEGRFPIDKLITTYPFEKINEAVDDQPHGKVLKPVLVL